MQLVLLLFGTVSAAARHAQAAHGLRKVLIFDFDVHHGGAVQWCVCVELERFSAIRCRWKQTNSDYESCTS